MPTDEMQPVQPAEPAAVVVRPAGPDDARGIAAIHVRSWQVAYAGIVPAAHLASLSVDKRERLWRDSMARGASHLLVADAGDRLAGFISFGRSRDEGAGAAEGEVWAVYVEPGDWGRGVGKRLWTATLAALREQGFRSVSLWVFPENDRACRYYRSLGFAAEPDSLKTFELAGAVLREIRYRRLVDG